MKINSIICNIIYFFLIIEIFCQSKKDDEPSSCIELDNSKNKFILKTNLSQNELEQILSKNFSFSIENAKNKNKRHRNKNTLNENVKEFKSKDNLNKTILLLELSNITEIINESKSNDETLYELIDTKDNNETKIFLSFDKFFKTQYKEMFEYSYTIVIFLVILIIFIIYYTFILPNEAPDWNINAPVANDNSRKSQNQNIHLENEYILKDNDI